MASSTIELQISAQTFTDQVLQTLLASPRPLPPAKLGMQLQRIRYRDVSLRRDTDASFQIFHVNHGADVGLGYEWITARQTQLAIDVTAEITAEANIAANPNRLATPDLTIDGTLLFDLEVTQPAIGVLQLETKFRDLELGFALPSLAGIVDPKAWAIEQIKATLNVKPIKFDLRDMLADGNQFWNAGIALDAAGQALTIRAEAHDNGFTAAWTNFYNGSITNRLAGSDWAVIALPADLQLTIQTLVWAKLSDALGRDRIENVIVGYTGQGSRAAFTITPRIRVWDAVIEAFVDTFAPTLGVAISFENGAVVVDVDGSEADDVADVVRGVIAGLVIALVPFAGWLAAIVLNEVLGALLDEASHAVADAVSDIDGLPAGTTVEETGRFQYRARVPFTAPAALPGAITTFNADADAITVGGVWSSLNLSEGELVVDTSKFVRTVPWIACGAAGTQALYSFDAHPGNNTVVHAESSLSSTGSAPVSVDAVTNVNVPAPETGLTVARSAPMLPSKIDLDGPNGIPFNGPAVVEVRTSVGVVHLSFEPVPGGIIGEQELKFLRSQLAMNLAVCDATSIPLWWFKKHFGGLFGGQELTGAQLKAILDEQTVDTLPAFYHVFNLTGTGSTGVHIDTSGFGTLPS